jgi:HTH-type transcriptional regulator / antitoxin HigA
MNAAVSKIERRYSALNALVPIHPLRSKADYTTAVGVLNELLDSGAANERHPLAGLVGTLGQLIADYDAQKYAIADVTGVEAIRFLMRQHGLRQSDLPEIGTQGVVSDVLGGRRQLNARQIRALATRFEVSPTLFL